MKRKTKRILIGYGSSVQLRPKRKYDLLVLLSTNNKPKDDDMLNVDSLPIALRIVGISSLVAAGQEIKSIQYNTIQ